MKTRNPKDLAEAVRSTLKARRLSCPPFRSLTELFEALYLVSLKTEESHRASFHITYLDPSKPDPRPPKRIVKDRWSCTKLSTPIPLNPSNLIKISQASDTRTSSFAVFHEGARLFIWGLIDQATGYYSFLHHDAESGPERPGLFQANIAGIGHLIAYVGYEKIAELRQNILVRTALDIFKSGPVRKRLEPGLVAYRRRLRKRIPATAYSAVTSSWTIEIDSYWIHTLSRLLLRIQNLHHGGAILITPDTAFKGLAIKYRLNYERLRSSVEDRAVSQILQLDAFDHIMEDHVEHLSATIPTDLYLRERRLGIDLDENRSELDGSLWFISLLTRVDGLVLMNADLVVKGFGVEITTVKRPSHVFVSTTQSASPRSLNRLDYNMFGTRHRSMIRYCYEVRGSIGFVISQDGDVRAMTKCRNRLIIWDNLKLQYDDFIQQLKPKGV